jgi:riboflavin synthase
MFTGIIDHYGLITQINKIPSGHSIWIKSCFSELELGESIAVDGICLTVTEIKDDSFSCDISPETISVTTAKYLAVGCYVNLERALTLSSRLSGHLVSGHIDQVARVEKILQHDQFTEMVFTDIHNENMALILKKGSIAINGVSLTINGVSKNAFSVMLIPHTLERTTLSKLLENNYVNLEFDMVARVIVNQTKEYLTNNYHNSANV